MKTYVLIIIVSLVSPLFFAQAQNSSARDAKTIEVINRQTSVKTQDKVSACSIFSATAILENKLIQLGLEGPEVDLSEQWLVYVTAGQKGKYGIKSQDNIRAYNHFGFVTEDFWPFNPTPWSSTKEISLFANPSNFFKRKNRCGNLKKSGSELLNHCYIGQRDPRLLMASDEELLSKGNELSDPEFYNIRAYANEMKSNYKINGFILRPSSNKKKILNLLNNGEALLLDVDFYYEAWNHSKAPDKGLTRDMDLWSQGIVSYPHPKSKDFHTSPSGHSVVVVGYDENKVIERTVEGVDGKPLTVRTVGVYYFKNSWGSQSFGRNFTIQGENFPGYGMISMDYANQKGEFVQITINGK